MIHPLFISLAKRPRLFMEHADAYAALALAEAADWQVKWQHRAMVGTAAAVLVSLALGLAGVAALLVAALPLEAMPQPWLLVVVPLVALVLGLWLAWRARRMAPVPAFAALREQVSQDLATLKLLDEER